ncbi:21 kDa seed protein [Hibiscus syriacus]|uniref:21 kDa seed protein n=1 Tax=Hibiscus syriacus TaxID=106335 RepID=A0A6A2YV97_HIBSY|nr:21 kDa seed protein-like [Hibiscus syriacus]KAE8683358.1 21 kDa seed protein [Hibiscus syriacus]
MKTTSASVILFFVMFGLANAANNAVLDINGDYVVTGVPYYVMSGIWDEGDGDVDGGGGLAIGRESGRKCPEIVVQRQSDADFGNPVIFSNADHNDDVVRVSSDVNLKFTGKRDRLCQTSTVWKVQNIDDSTEKRFVELGGEEGNPGCDTKQSWFKIEETGTERMRMYKFKYCPSVCGSSATDCNEIERAEDEDGQMRLALSEGEGEGAWPWVFLKANEPRSRIRQVVRA